MTVRSDDLRVGQTITYKVAGIAFDGRVARVGEATVDIESPGPTRGRGTHGPIQFARGGMTTILKSDIVSGPKKQIVKKPGDSMPKKTAEQLDREIAEVLAGKSPAEAVAIAQKAADKAAKKAPQRRRHHSSISDSEKIREVIARFPATFGLRGFPGRVFRISPMSSYVSGGRVMLYTQRKDDDGWQDFSKGTEAELRGQITR